jgi:predicted dehydrogenase
VTRDGTPFRIDTPDFLVSMLELEGGPIVRLTTSFYTGQQTRNAASMEFHGDAGSLFLEHFFRFDGSVQVAEHGDAGSYAAVPAVRHATKAMDWSRAVADMAESITDGRPHRATGEQAAHIVDVLAAAAESVASARPVDVTTSFTQPEPMPWAV